MRVWRERRSKVMAARTLRRLCALAVAGGAMGCLEPGGPYLEKLAQSAPTVISINPAETGDPPARRLPQGQRLVITFSEEMDPHSLVGGISVLLGRTEIPIQVYTLTTPATRYEGTQTPYEVQVGPGEGMRQFDQDSSYSLLLRTLLLDAEGNPVSAEQTVPFRVVPSR